ncbi:MAG: hypothetical protein RLN90_06770 [Balneolaceae bacterium]
MLIRFSSNLVNNEPSVVLIHEWRSIKGPISKNQNWAMNMLESRATELE